MKPWLFLQGIFVCLSVGGTASLLAESPRPNVVLICVDDLKPILGCYGDPIAKTPHLDALAARSVRFEAAYCNQAVCSPSRNSLLTSLRPQTLGIYDLSTHFRDSTPDAITLPQQFLINGYRTESLGKILHTGHGNRDDAASWSVPSWRPGGPTYALAENLASRVEIRGNLRGPATEAADVDDDTYGDGKTAAAAVRRLEAAAANRDQPFFLAVGFVKPHLPFVAPQKYWDLYDAAQLPMPAVTVPPQGAPSYAPASGGELRGYSDMQSGPIDEARTRRLIHGYYAATSYTDAQIGRVLQAIQDHQLDQNTIVVLWGDHGWHLGDHGMWCKHSNYEQAARIPLMVSAPGRAAGVASSALVETVDIYPTLCELAGLPAATGIDGVSFAKVLDDPQHTVRPAAIHVYPRENRIGRAIRNDRYRLVQWKVPGSADDSADIELYDYQEDALETRNLATERPEVVAQLLAILSEHPEAKAPFQQARAAEAAREGRAEMFQRRDRDNDGKLSRREFLRNQTNPNTAAARFERFDVDKDGFLSKEEFVYQGNIPRP